MKSKLSLMSYFLLVLTVSCGSTKSLHEEEHDEIERNYEVKDASSGKRPGWIEDPNLWAKENGEDVANYRFFSLETTPMVDRDIACQSASAKVKAEVAGEVATLIEDKLSELKEGASEIDANAPDFKAMEQFVTTSLTAKIQSHVHGVSVVKKYWEKRNYLEDLGAPKDYVGFTCAVFMRIQTADLQKLVSKARDQVTQQLKDETVKAKVEASLNTSLTNTNGEKE